MQQAGHFSGWINDDPTLALFHKHFAVMHSLYRLRHHYAEQGRELAISPLNIQLLPTCAKEAEATQVTASAHGVEQFYLEWAHFAEATSDTVTELLKDFWRRYAAVDDTVVALQRLGLEGEADWKQVQARYRRLAAEHHPDKGGDSEEFTQIREAYETLKARFGR